MNIATSSNLAVWLPDKIDQDVPPYLAILHALERDVKKGSILPGVRLAPQRTLASHLGISIATVGRAYREAAALGLISGRPGQGTFVQTGTGQAKARAASTLLNLGSNFAPRGQQGRQIRAALSRLSKSADLSALEEPSSHQGLLQHRATLLDWIAVPGLPNVTERTFVTNGAQHGLDLALQLLAAPGETVLAESLTYIGFKALASLRKTPLSPVEIDEEGLVPEALDAAFRRERARVVYAMPSLHSVTARTMSASRRQAIARVLEEHDAYLIEDDVYGFLLRDRPMPIASLQPSRTIFLASFSKMLNVGFRVGLMVVPGHLIDQANAAMRSTTWSASPLMAEIVVQLIRDGSLSAIADEIISISRERQDVFVKAFRDVLTPAQLSQPTGYHVWLPLADGVNAQEFFVAAQRRGILVTPPGLASVDDKPEAGVRICLGGFESTLQMEAAIAELRELVQRPAAQFLSIA